MYTGWFWKFKPGRPMEPQERLDTLSRKAGRLSNDRHCVISFSSTYIDVIDRRYRLRGMVVTTLITLVSAGLALWGIWLFGTWVPDVYEGRALDWVLIGTLAVGFVGQFLLMYKLVIGRDFFTYKYYPIPFNRRTRMVHAYTDGGASGVISVPWEEGHFHLGHGRREKFLRNIRCHVMERELIKQTFAVGHYFDDPDKIREIWEFIRRYMDEGPAGLVEAPESSKIHLSVSDSWKSCYLTVVISFGRAALPFRGLLMPFIGLLAASRWLVLRSSKAPVWPQHIVDESRIDAGDPCRLPEPEYVGQFYDEHGN